METNSAKTNKVHCDLCNVDVPSTESMAIHEEGKRHRRLFAEKERLLSLAEKSVFLSGLVSGFDEAQVKVEFEKQFGAVERVIPSKQHTTSGVVEFTSKEAAQNALSAKRVQIGADDAFISPRKLNFDKVDEVNKKLLEMECLIEEIRYGSDYDQQIDYLIEKYGMAEQEIQQRQEAMKKLVTCLKEYFCDEVDIILFGSSVTGLGIKSSDADAALVFTSGSLKTVPTNKRLNVLGRDKMTLLTCDVSVFQNRRIQRLEFAHLLPADRVRLLSKILNDIRKRFGYFANQYPVLDARCPLVRFTFEGKIAFDLSIDNQLSAAKSSWLKHTIEISPLIVRRFLFGLRIWAVSNGLFDGQGLPKGFFNSYMLNTLAISYLQVMGYIAPHEVVQSMEEEQTNEWNLHFDRSRVEANEGLQLSQLFKEFFVFCLQTDHKSVVHVLSRNAIVSIDEFKESIVDDDVKNDFKFNLINVQDPIEHSHNVTMNIGVKYLALMRQKMMLSISKLKHSTKNPNFIDILSVEHDPQNASGLSKTSESEFMIDLKGKKGDVFSSMDDVFNRILMCNTICDPPAKRRRCEATDETYEKKFEAIHPVWIGRRGVRRALRGDNLAFVALETTVSRQVAEKQKPLEAALKIDVAGVVSSEGVLSVSLRRIEGGDQDYHDFTHFLYVTGFLQTCLLNLLR